MLSERLVQRFWLARTWVALSFAYAAGFLLAALFVGLATGPESTNYQHAFLFNSGAVAALWVALILARPKPRQARARSLYAALEYVLVGLIFSLGLVLFYHHGWHIAASAPAGFAAIAWGIGWIAAWLGPVFVGVVALLLGHWLWLSVFMDYRSACWRFVEEEHTATLLSDLQQHLQVDSFLREKDAQYVGRKLVHWQLSAPWKTFELELPSSAAYLYGQMQAGEPDPMLLIEKRSASERDKVIQRLTVAWPQPSIKKP